MNHISSPPHALNLFESMKKDYKLCEENYLKDFKSHHWDVFPENYENILKNEDLWKSFLRNQISLGFNDSLMEVSNKRFENNNDAYWQELKKNDTNLVDKTIVSQEKIDNTLSIVNFLLRNNDPSFLLKNLMPDVGDPETTSLEIRNPDNSNIYFSANYHDIVEIYYFLHLQDVLMEMKNIKKPIIAEIGAGYGGIATKIKKNLNDCKYIIFDLPEVNAVQNYYLSNVFPEKKIIGYNEYKMSKNILKDNFDFLLLPGWEIKNFKRNSIDTIINMRSMMEMNHDVIKFYFKSIHRIIKHNGIFFNANRYIKRDIKLEDYPYDKKWKIVKSQQSEVQKNIHILTTKRTNKEENFQVQEYL